jgi:uncharacterized protein (TIGR02996 family)
MDIQAAFLSDIAANADDDAPRLVYADWLDENGDPDRARFIRVQCRLASMGKFDLDRYELEGQEEELLRLHGKKWRKPLAKFTVDVEFQRGFPHRIGMPAVDFATKGEELFAIAPTLRHYRAKRPQQGWDEMLTCAALEKITSLDAGQSGITVGRVRALARSARVRNLRELGLINAPLRGALTDLAASPHLEGVRALSVGRCRLGNDGLDALLRGRLAANLTSLDLADNELGVGALARLAGWEGSSRLERLVLSEHVPGADDAIAFAAGDWSGLHELILCLFRAGNNGLEALARNHTLSGLRDLIVIFENDLRWAPLLTSENLTNLERLMIGRAVASADLRDLAAGPLLPHLHALWFYAPEAAGVVSLLSSPASAGLRELSLHGEVDDARRVATALADAQHLTNLRKLTLTQMPFGVEGTRALAGAAHLAGLVHLNVGSCGLDAECAKALAVSPHLNHLRKLDMRGSVHDAAALRPLVERFGEDVVTR